MHSTRIMAIVGALVGVIGLFLKALSTNAPAEVTKGMNAQNPEFPASMPTIWSGLATWAQIVLVILIVVVLVLSVMGLRSVGMDRTSSGIVTLIGIALFVYAIVKWMDASDSADKLTAGLAQAAQGGQAPPDLSVSVSAIGFVLLLVGTAVVAIAGALGLRSRPAT